MGTHFPLWASILSLALPASRGFHALPAREGDLLHPTLLPRGQSRSLLSGAFQSCFCRKTDGPLPGALALGITSLLFNGHVLCDVASGMRPWLAFKSPLATFAGVSLAIFTVYLIKIFI